MNSIVSIVYNGRKITMSPFLAVSEEGFLCVGLSSVNEQETYYVKWVGNKLILAWSYLRTLGSGAVKRISPEREIPEIDEPDRRMEKQSKIPDEELDEIIRMCNDPNNFVLLDPDELLTAVRKRVINHTKEVSRAFTLGKKMLNERSRQLPEEESFRDFCQENGIIDYYLRKYREYTAEDILVPFCGRDNHLNELDRIIVRSGIMGVPVKLLPETGRPMFSIDGEVWFTISSVQYRPKSGDVWVVVESVITGENTIHKLRELREMELKLEN